MLILENEWLEENQVEMNLIYEYDYNQSMLISSEKYGNYDIQVSFYRLQYDAIADGFFIKSKIKDVTFKNRREIKRFIETIPMIANQNLH